MANATADVTGATPLSFTTTSGGQQVVPLSALEFRGSVVQIKAIWKAAFDAGEQATLLALANTKAAAGELRPQPCPPPAPALALTAAHPGPEGNGITVTVETEKDKPALSAQIKLSATEVDTWGQLVDGDAAAHKVGVDKPTGVSGDPRGATGLVAIKSGSTNGSKKPPVPSSGMMEKKTGVDLKDEDKAIVCTLLPRDDYVGKGGLKYEVTRDGATFAITATYDSTKEAGTQTPVTLLTLGDLADPVAYLVSAAPPPRGAALPADSSAHLSGGTNGFAAASLLYT